jgi:protein-L-isoaspartate(D-aspartate) O-methyltransferase
MVARLRDHYGIRDPRVLEAMRNVPRHFFVPEALQSRAYGDHALPISANQTISQPFIVAKMTELLELDANSRVLEIGAGSGYQTACCLTSRSPGLLDRTHRRSRARSPGKNSPTRDLQRDCEVFDGTLGWAQTRLTMEFW